MLEEYQVINKDGLPEFVVIRYDEFIKIKDLLNDTEKLEDHLDTLF
jgi:hypothetical protein